MLNNDLIVDREILSKNLNELSKKLNELKLSNFEISIKNNSVIFYFGVFEYLQAMKDTIFESNINGEEQLDHEKLSLQFNNGNGQVIKGFKLTVSDKYFSILSVNTFIDSFQSKIKIKDILDKNISDILMLFKSHELINNNLEAREIDFHISFYCIDNANLSALKETFGLLMNKTISSFKHEKVKLQIQNYFQEQVSGFKLNVDKKYFQHINIRLFLESYKKNVRQKIMERANTSLKDSPLNTKEADYLKKLDFSQFTFVNSQMNRIQYKNCLHYFASEEQKLEFKKLDEELKSKQSIISRLFPVETKNVDELKNQDSQEDKLCQEKSYSGPTSKTKV